jgi:hypothetical protein
VGLARATNPYFLAVAGILLSVQLLLWWLLPRRPEFFVVALVVEGFLFAIWEMYGRPIPCPADRFPCQSHGADLADLAGIFYFGLPLAVWTSLTAIAAAAALLPSLLKFRTQPK